MNMLRSFRVAVLVLVWTTANLWGQAEGSIRIVVAPESAGLTVVTRNIDTNHSYSSETGTNGIAVLRAVPAGRYTVTVSGVTSRIFVLELAATVQVDVTLPQSNSETATVTATPEPIALSGGAVTTTITRTEIENLPLNGRNTMELALTAPGVGGEFGDREGGNALRVPVGGAGLSIGGGRTGSSAFLVDGLNVTSAGYGRDSARPSPETVAEFKTITSSFGAELGFTGGGVVSVLTRSGTNDFRGSAFWRHRDPALAARTFNQALPPGLHSNEVGATYGGPLRRNRTFFFANGQFRRERDAVDLLWKTPTAEERLGDFRNSYVKPGGAPALLYQQAECANAACGKLAPLQRPAAGYGLFSGGGLVIPSRYLDPVALKVLRNVPLPNIPRDADGNNYLGQRGSTSRDNRWSLRLDHRLTRQSNLWGRYTDTPTYADRYRVSRASTAFGLPSDRAVFRQAATGGSKSFGSNTVATFRAGFLFFDSSRTPPGDLATRNYTKDEFGFPNATGWGYPGFSLGDGYATWGLDSSAGLGRSTERQQEIGQDWNLVRGRHSVSFGANWRWQQLNEQSIGLNDACCPTFVFDAGVTGSGTNGKAPITGGNSLASFLLGVPQFVDLRAQTIPYFYRHHAGALYGQDEFRPRPNLTLTAGLRWDFTSPRRERDNRQASVDLPHPFLVPNDKGVPPYSAVNYLYSGFGRSVYLEPLHKLNFAPRLALAWAPKWRTPVVLRAGYGISFLAATGRGRQPLPDFGQGQTSAWNYTPWVETGKPLPTQSSDPAALIGIGRNAPAVVADPRILEIAANGVLCASCRPFDPRVPPGDLIAFASENESPYVQHWNLTAQASLGRNVVLSVSYLGQKGTHLYLPPLPGNNPDPIAYRKLRESGIDPDEIIPDPFNGLDPKGNARTFRRSDLLRPFPGLGNILTAGNTGANSIYHAGTFSLERRFERGFGTRIHYTWAKSIDTASDSLTEGKALYSWGMNRVQNPLDPRNDRSVAAFDQRHRLTATFNWNAPFRVRSSRWVNALVRNWSAHGLTSIFSGFPFAPSLGVPDNGVPDGNLGAWQGVRPDMVAGVPILNPRWSKSAANDVPYINPEAFALTAYGTLGNAPRTLDYGRGPWRQQVDVLIARDLYRGAEGRRRIEIHASIFNLFNHAGFQIGPNRGTTLFDGPLAVSSKGPSLAGPIPYFPDAPAAMPGSRESALANAYNQSFGKLGRNDNGPGRIVQIGLKVDF
jgi:hypothetical protein